MLLVASNLFAAPGQSFEAARKHWAYQPLTNPIPPKVQAAKRVQSPIDSFLLAKLEQKKLSFATPADKRTLLRRVYFDLIGLPPTFEEIQAFERDRSKTAFADVVEHLLASPRYGERWGRHWLDVARYADTKDLVLVYGKDALRPYAYTYRDYVIRAFNEDLPYDKFVQDQLAADLLQPSVARWRLAALGFLTLGRLFDNNVHDQIDDQIDTTGRALLGLTVACARCHDHKYDAITQKDYYGLYGVFASTHRPYDLPLIEDPKSVPGGLEFEQQLAKARQELEQHIDSEFAKWTENLRQRIGDYLVRAATTKPDLKETTLFALSQTPEDFRPTIVWRTRRFIAERAKPEDHVFGPWAELMDLPQENFAPLAGGVMTNRLRSALEKPGSYNQLVLEGLGKTSLTNKESVARVYGEDLRSTYELSKNPSNHLGAEHLELVSLLTNKTSPVWFPRRDTADMMSRAETDRYHALVANLDKVAANATNPPPARAMVVADLPEPYEPHIFKRGNASRPAEPVPRAFLQVLSGGEPAPFVHGSGRLELAQAITSPTNPLTARVFVNRVWLEHFGEPLVGSPSDFGTRSEPPKNPELLDWLASDFIRSGWSLKHLHRVILLSSAYQQSSMPSAAGPDAENKLLSHFNRRRLDFEAMRDSALAICGRLDQSLGGRPIDLTIEPLSQRRAVYALVDRQNLPALFRAFDFPVPDQCIERRPLTTVPQQALFGLNSPFMMEQASALAGRCDANDGGKPAERVDQLFRQVYGRHATRHEINRSLQFVESAKADATATSLAPWVQLAQALLISNEAMFID